MWFSQAEYDSVTGIAKITFAPKLAEFLAAMKWLYSKINLKDIGNLQSRFAIRLFEIAISYRSMAGCDGNQENAWYFERGFPDEMRLIMGVDEKAYKDKHVLKQKIVDNPIKGINEAGLGLEIKPTTIKQGRQVIAIRFNCTSAPRTPKGTGRKRLKAELHQEEQDLQRLKELQPPGIRGAISGHYGQPFSVSEKAKAHRNLR
jgi:plasmid replication initiation protein